MSLISTAALIVANRDASAIYGRSATGLLTVIEVLGAPVAIVLVGRPWPTLHATAARVDRALSADDLFTTALSGDPADPFAAAVRVSADRRCDNVRPSIIPVRHVRWMAWAACVSALAGTMVVAAAPTRFVAARWAAAPDVNASVLATDFDAPAAQIATRPPMVDVARPLVRAGTDETSATAPPVGTAPTVLGEGRPTAGRGYVGSGSATVGRGSATSPPPPGPVLAFDDRPRAAIAGRGRSDDATGDGGAASPEAGRLSAEGPSRASIGVTSPGATSPTARDGEAAPRETTRSAVPNNGGIPVADNALPTADRSLIHAFFGAPS